MCEFKKFHVTQAKTFNEHQKRTWNELKRTKLPIRYHVSPGKLRFHTTNKLENV